MKPDEQDLRGERVSGCPTYGRPALAAIRDRWRIGDHVPISDRTLAERIEDYGGPMVDAAQRDIAALVAEIERLERVHDGANAAIAAASRDLDGAQYAGGLAREERDRLRAERRCCGNCGE